MYSVDISLYCWSNPPDARRQFVCCDVTLAQWLIYFVTWDSFLWLSRRSTGHPLFVTVSCSDPYTIIHHKLGGYKTMVYGLHFCISNATVYPRFTSTWIYVLVGNFAPFYSSFPKGIYHLSIQFHKLLKHKPHAIVPHYHICIYYHIYIYIYMYYRIYYPT